MHFWAQPLQESSYAPNIFAPDVNCIYLFCKTTWWCIAGLAYLEYLSTEYVIGWASVQNFSVNHFGYHHLRIISGATYCCTSISPDPMSTLQQHSNTGEVYHARVIRSHDGPQNHVFLCVYTLYLVLITIMMGYDLDNELSDLSGGHSNWNPRRTPKTYISPRFHTIFGSDYYVYYYYHVLQWQ